MTGAKPKDVTTGGPQGRTHPLLGNPELVAFGKLRVSVERFQVRNPKACNFVTGLIKGQESAQLSATLVQLIEAGITLDPLVIWQDSEGTRWVIDGHHRMEAMTEAGTTARAKVWVQRFKGETEVGAREFALQINKRVHLNMHPSERLDSYWRSLLCGEITGSVRGRVKLHDVSQSTVQRMDKERAAVLAQLRLDAADQGAPLDVSFIRANAPAWKELAAWREGSDTGRTGDADRKVVEGMLRTLTLRFATHAKAQPYVLIEAFQEFIQEATGRAVEVRFASDEEGNSRAEVDVDSDF